MRRSLQIVVFVCGVFAMRVPSVDAQVKGRDYYGPRGANYGPLGKEGLEWNPLRRTWVDVSGKFKVVAIFEDMKDGTVVLQQENGDHVRVPLEKLADGDQGFVREWISKSPQEKVRYLRDELKKDNKSLEGRLRVAEAKVEPYNPLLMGWDKKGIKALADAGRIRGLLSARWQALERLEHGILGKDSPYVEVEGGVRLKEDIKEEKEYLARRDAKVEALRKANSDPRSTADTYIKTLLEKGVLKEASFLSERAGSPFTLEQGREAKTYYYRVNYVSNAGILMEKDAEVVVLKVPLGFWQVSEWTDWGDMGIRK